MNGGEERSFTPHEARRYGRQMLLPTIAASGQRNLLNSKVLVIGAGGIGSSAALYLAAAGVPITVLDHDLVEESNLHRQIIHDVDLVQKFKAHSAVARLTAINPTLVYQAITDKLTADNAYDIIQPFELVLDCTDNFEARYVINDACVLLKVPFVSGSAVGLEGQITVIIPGETPCYRCLYPNPSAAEACRSCANSGVLGPVPGLIGCLEATEAIKILLKGLHLKSTTASSSSSSSSSSNTSAATNNLQVLTGRQLFYDAAQGDFFSFDLPPRDPHCVICSDHPTYTSLADTKQFLTKFHEETQCAVNAYLGDIPTEHKLSITDFHHLLASIGQKPENLKEAVYVVDVRSPVQYGIANLAKSPLIHQSYPQFYEWLSNLSVSSSGVCGEISDNMQKKTVLFNLPLAQLQSSNTAHTLLKTVLADETKDFTTILVMCRRGIDSTVATRLLLETLQQESLMSNGHKLQILNVEGGLTAWHRDIDPSFPMY